MAAKHIYSLEYLLTTIIGRCREHGYLLKGNRYLEMCNRNCFEIFIYLSLTRKISQTYADVSVASLNGENQSKIILYKIKVLYGKDQNSLAYTANNKFESCHRSSDMTITII